MPRRFFRQLDPPAEPAQELAPIDSAAVAHASVVASAALPPTPTAADACVNAKVPSAPQKLIYSSQTSTTTARSHPVSFIAIALSVVGAVGFVANLAFPLMQQPLEEMSLSARDMAEQLNAQWNAGDTPVGGLLVHVMDGAGINGDGFVGYSPGQIPSAMELWAGVGQPNATRWAGDRLAASIINRDRNMTYSMELWTDGCPQLKALSEYYSLPTLVLNASALLDRFSCCYPRDGGTLGFTCSQQGGDESCVPGCNFSDTQILSGIVLDHNPAYGLDEVSDCLAVDAQQSAREREREMARPDVATLFNVSLAGLHTLLSVPGQYAYNEVVLDTWRGGGWGRGEDLQPLISAIFW